MLIQKQCNILILLEIFFIFEKVKEAFSDFSKGIVKVLWFYFISLEHQHKMTQYNTFDVKLSNWLLNKLKSGTKNGTEVNLKFSSNLIRNSDDETNFPLKILLTDTRKWFIS